ncbi:hypothetical protein [Halofilum ochraceum]|uniref:hypothetical protein n=1 Tax=Halofilum ochraceum TaxID=1611323 RepID=UPI000834C003|nr:hypothetical protein [Halofilum ochraceum]
MKKRFQSKIRALVAGGGSVLLVACGGGGSGGGSGTETGTETSTTSTLSGNVELVDGTADVRSWDERLLAFFVADVHAALGGLIDAPDGTAVRLIRIDQDGNEVDQLDTSTTTDGRFEFEIDSDIGTGGDLIIEAGSASDPVRAPAGGEDIRVNPISSMIVNRVLARVQGGAAFSDFRAVDLANLIAIIVEELEANPATITGASNADFTTNADAEAGDDADELIASVEGENAVADNFIGTKNLAVLDVLLEAFGETAGFAAVNQTLSADITSSLRLDGSGQTSEESRSERGWSFDGGGGVSSTQSQTTATETLPEDAGFSLTVGKDGRLTAANGGIRGAVSSDGDLFAMTETRTELNGNGASFGLFTGASSWAPGDVTETFNYVKLTGYIDLGSDQVGFLNTLTGDADLACIGGSCDLTLDRFGAGGALRKFFSQVGPGTTLSTDSTAVQNFNGFSLAGVLALNGFDLGSTGRIGGSVDVSGKDYRTRGFVAPDARMMALQVSSEDVGVFAEELFIALPQGQSCDQATLDGTYNTVWLTAVMSGAAPEQIAVENEAFSVDVDGAAGTIGIPAASFREAVLTFDGTNSNLSRDVIEDTSASVGYGVATDCKLEIADQPGDVALGAVSPDGEVFVIATYTQEGSDETFQSIAIGMRRPAQQ